jgi:hypothetical protein
MLMRSAAFVPQQAAEHEQSRHHPQHGGGGNPQAFVNDFPFPSGDFVLQARALIDYHNEREKTEILMRRGSKNSNNGANGPRSLLSSTHGKVSGPSRLSSSSNGGALLSSGAISGSVEERIFGHTTY